MWLLVRRTLFVTVEIDLIPHFSRVSDPQLHPNRALNGLAVFQEHRVAR